MLKFENKVILCGKVHKILRIKKGEDWVLCSFLVKTVSPSLKNKLPVETLHEVTCYGNLVEKASKLCKDNWIKVNGTLTKAMWTTEFCERRSRTRITATKITIIKETQQV